MCHTLRHKPGSGQERPARPAAGRRGLAGVLAGPMPRSKLLRRMEMEKQQKTEKRLIAEGRKRM